MGIKFSAAGVLVIFMATLALSACGPVQRNTWAKEGLTEAELKRDQKACVAEANSYGFLSSAPNTLGSANANARQQADIYRACMARKGYFQGSGDTAKPGQPQKP